MVGVNIRIETYCGCQCVRANTKTRILSALHTKIKEHKKRDIFLNISTII